jgi:hypothetical protein
MSAQRFAEIIRGVCGIFKLDAQQILDGGSIQLGGVRIALTHGEGKLAPLLTMYCDFGPVPKELEAQVYRKLLESNLSTYTGQGETYCMTAEGRVVYANNFLMETLTPEIMAGSITLATLHAQKWREDYFLPHGEGAAKKSRSNPLHERWSAAAGGSPS